MLKIKFAYLLFFCVLFSSIACSNSDSESVEKIVDQVDNVNPTITCVADINVTVASTASNTVVNYTTPVGTDNNAGAVTTQTAGVQSGGSFPAGTTTNTFLVKDTAGNTTSCSFNVIVTKDAPSADLPYFVDVNPAPSGKKWTKIENLSDEFNTNILDEVKWKNTDPAQWVGRAPGLFKKNTVSLADGKLKLTSDMLPAPEVVNGTTFTHAGSYIASNASAEAGLYFECKMKANKTFMSSTFWLINKRNEATGCDFRTTELDIQECVGEITTTAAWAQTFNSSMSSNTHSRNTTCPETPTGSVGNKAALSTKAYDDYHVYAAWWKSTTEVEFYLDGKKVGNVTPKADFNLKMYLRMVVETYDWNPTPSGGGMSGTEAERTTYYDWVRTWKLEDN
jgi:hypothetical protein